MISEPVRIEDIWDRCALPDHVVRQVDEIGNVLGQMGDPAAVSCLPSDAIGDAVQNLDNSVRAVRGEEPLVENPDNFNKAYGVE